MYDTDGNDHKTFERFAVSALARTILDAEENNQKASVYCFLKTPFFSDLCDIAEYDEKTVRKEVKKRLGDRENWSSFQQFLSFDLSVIFDGQSFDELMCKYVEFLWSHPWLEEKSFLEIKSDLIAIGFTIIKDKKHKYRIVEKV